MSANPVTLDYNAATQAYRANATARRQARDALVQALTRKARQENEYRKALSLAFARHRGAGKPVDESQIHAKADAADFALRRDLADAEAKGIVARLAELEAERVTLRDLTGWAREES